MVVYLFLLNEACEQVFEEVTHESEASPLEEKIELLPIYFVKLIGKLRNFSLSSLLRFFLIRHLVYTTDIFVNFFQDIFLNCRMVEYLLNLKDLLKAAA